jgi:hypothetical protein
VGGTDAEDEPDDHHEHDDRLHGIPSVCAPARSAWQEF